MNGGQDLEEQDHRRRGMGNVHWLTRYDPGGGEPYGELCYCEVGDDHDAAGNVTDPDPNGGA